jgi:hypothetical protein
LVPGASLTAGHIDTWREHVFRVANLVLAREACIVGGHVESASIAIEDVFTEPVVVRCSWVAELETEGSSADEGVPFNRLGIVGGTGGTGGDAGAERRRVAPEGVGEEESSEGVALLISTVGIKF